MEETLYDIIRTSKATGRRTRMRKGISLERAKALCEAHNKNPEGHGKYSVDSYEPSRNQEEFPLIRRTI